jgi:hypothetical protein
MCELNGLVGTAEALKKLLRELVESTNLSLISQSRELREFYDTI